MIIVTFEVLLAISGIVFADLPLADNSIDGLWERLLRDCQNTKQADVEVGLPATEAEIIQLESELNVTLPEDYKRSLRLHNGMTSFINGWELLSTDGVYSEWKSWSQMLEEGEFDNIPDENLNQNDAVAKSWWSKSWIPVAVDGAGNSNCIDMKPGKTGIVGQVIDMDHEVGDRKVEANSYAQWLEDKVTRLEKGEDSC